MPPVDAALLAGGGTDAVGTGRKEVARSGSNNAPAAARGNSAGLMLLVLFILLFGNTALVVVTVRGEAEQAGDDYENSQGVGVAKK